jgi:amino acid transporter
MSGPPIPPEPPQPLPDEPTLPEKVRRAVVGKPKSLEDKRVFHQLSLVAFFAWVGLGADGLSSSAYGPEEAFKTLGTHTYLVPLLALLMAATVFIISAAYTRIIEEFPQGGGGYVVTSKLMGPRWGVVAGSALLVDYVLTITVSIAAAGDAIFSFLPADWAPWKFWVQLGLIVLLTMLNIRGVKESVYPLTPIFVLFLITHAMLIVGTPVTQAAEIGPRAQEQWEGFRSGLAALGTFGMLKIFVHAYSMGGGTFTGIEAVSNAIPIMREPRVQTARRAMTYMSISLAIAASGLLMCYLLWRVPYDPNKTMNAVLLERVSAEWGLGHWFVVVTLVTEATLLIVAAQAGFFGGPRVLANMAVDSWAPRRFAALSERLTAHNGILLMGLAAVAALWYATSHADTAPGTSHGGHGHRPLDILVVMYSINVFVTFALSMYAMARHVHGTRGRREHWKKRLTLFVVGFALCATILVITVIEKFPQGGWVTLVVTGAVVVLSMLIHGHYQTVFKNLRKLYATLEDLPQSHKGAVPALDPKAATAAIFVASYGGVGIHTVLNVFRAFPGHFKNIVFLSVGVMDSGAFKGVEELEALKGGTEENLKKYVRLANQMGIPATYRLAIGTDAVAEAEELGRELAKEFPRTTFFAGYILFQRERWYQRLLHNETAFAIQRRIQWAGLTMVVLPARVQ